MKAGNILVIGNSGVGKSTLINAILGEKVAKTAYGTHGTTSYLTIYEGEEIPFRLIDTIGFERTYMQRRKAINAVKKWGKDCANKDDKDRNIHLIWFCIDAGYSIFDSLIQDFLQATKIWSSVPIIVVITKSYSIPERERNIELVYHAFAKHKKISENLKKVIPIVAEPFVLNPEKYDSVAPVEGLENLIEVSNRLLPDGRKAGEKDLKRFTLMRKRAWAHSVAVTFTGSATAVGAVPIPFVTDATILMPMEVTEIKLIAHIYDIKDSEETNLLVDAIQSAGTASVAARGALSAIKAIPGLHIAASLLNAVIAACFAFVIGEGSIYIFEQIYLGNKSLKDIEWAKNIVKERFDSKFIDKVAEVLKQVNDRTGRESIVKLVLQIFGKGRK